MAGEKEEEEEEEAGWAQAEGMVFACCYAIREIEHFVCFFFHTCQDAGVGTYRGYHYADRRGRLLFS